MNKKVYCLDCKYRVGCMDSIYEKCCAPDNIIYYHHDNYLYEEKYIEYIKTPKVRNKNNDCDLYKPNFFKRLHILN